LIDDDLRPYLDRAHSSVGARFVEWFAARHATRIARLEDASYGLIEMYRVEK